MWAFVIAFDGQLGTEEGIERYEPIVGLISTVQS
jgi:hypothetical protein